MLNPGDNECVRDKIKLMDVAPTVLDILGIEGEFGFEGKSLLKERKGS